MVALPGQLFYSTQIPVCLWFIARDKGAGTQTRRYRDRRGETLFIDARQMGSMIDRVHRELTDDDIARIAHTYHAWRGDTVGADAGADADVGADLRVRPNGGDTQVDPHKVDPYEDVPGFCKAATLDDIRGHNYILTPGRYVGAAEIEDDGEPFEEKMERLMAQLEEQFVEGARLEAAIRENLDQLWGTEP
jgi:type I restriction enzyme M protein